MRRRRAALPLGIGRPRRGLRGTPPRGSGRHRRRRAFAGPRWPSVLLARGARVSRSRGVPERGGGVRGDRRGPGSPSVPQRRSPDGPRLRGASEPLRLRRQGGQHARVLRHPHGPRERPRSRARPRPRAPAAVRGASAATRGNHARRRVRGVERKRPASRADLPREIDEPGGAPHDVGLVGRGLVRPADRRARLGRLRARAPRGDRLQGLHAGAADVAAARPKGIARARRPRRRRADRRAPPRARAAPHPRLRRARGLCILYLEGEAGSGKSTPVAALERDLAASGVAHHWIEAACDQTLRASLNPFLLAMRQHLAAFADAAAPGDRRASLEKAIAALSEGLAPLDPLRLEIDRLHSAIAALAGIVDPESLYERLDPKLRFENCKQAIRALVLALCRRQPTLVVLEDVHWMDADSREALGELARAAAGQPLAVICTGRPVADRGAFPGSGVASNTVTLPPLKREELRGMARAELGGFVSEELLTLVETHTRGNPLFAHQLLVHLREEGSIVETPEGLAVRAASVSAIPVDADAALVARLDRLPPADRHTVQAAAVLGRDVDVRVLAAVLGWDVERALGSLRVAEEQQIVERVSELHYAFRHAPMRDAAYAVQAVARRRQAHGRAAAAIEEQHAADRDDHQLGLHWESAEQAARAMPCYLAAGRRARRAFAHEEGSDACVPTSGSPARSPPSRSSPA
ncbi:MAG: AAA family ATPase [Acidobacteriota bacterium]